MPEKPNTFALKSFHGYYMTISKDVRPDLRSFASIAASNLLAPDQGEVYAAQKAPVDACALHFVKP